MAGPYAPSLPAVRMLTGHLDQLVARAAGIREEAAELRKELDNYEAKLLKPGPRRVLIGADVPPVTADSTRDDGIWDRPSGCVQCGRPCSSEWPNQMCGQCGYLTCYDCEDMHCCDASEGNAWQPRTCQSYRYRWPKWTLDDPPTQHREGRDDSHHSLSTVVAPGGEDGDAPCSMVWQCGHCGLIDYKGNAHWCWASKCVQRG